jgi:hypothetical protein
MQLRVPLLAGASRRVVSQNIGALRLVGINRAQAAKIAYKEADRSGGYQRKGKRR